MDNSRTISLDAQFAAAADWWHLAGVDLTFHDEPQSWLEPTKTEMASRDSRAQQSAPISTPPLAPYDRFGGKPAGWPRDLGALRDWWLADPSLGTESATQRVAWRGEARAKLMILVPMPEPDDVDHLLSGPQGRLISGMVTAMGLCLQRTCIAAALPSHMPDPDWPGLTRRGLGDVLLHLVALAAPERLLILGRNIPPLMGHDPAQGPAMIKETAIHVGKERRDVPTLAGFAPDRLLNNAKQRASLWHRWLDWTNGE